MKKKRHILIHIRQKNIDFGRRDPPRGRKNPPAGAKKFPPGAEKTARGDEKTAPRGRKNRPRGGPFNTIKTHSARKNTISREKTHFRENFSHEKCAELYIY